MMAHRARELRAAVAAVAAAAAAFLLAPRAAAGADWPRFRGPAGSGVSPDGDFPLEFGPRSHVAWKVSVPPGNSSPCIAGRRLFLTAFDDGALATLCFDRRDGRVLWRRNLEPGAIERGSRLSSPASSTPAASAGAVFVFFAPFGLISYDHAGRERWRRPLPTPVTQHGASSSPVLAGGRLVMACDQDVGSYLLAVDADTGAILWKTPRPGCRRGFATPLPWPAEAPRQVIVAGTLRVAGYDLAGGEEIWSAGGIPNEIVASPIAAGGLVIAGGWTYGSGVDTLPEFSALLEEGDADGDGRLTRAEAPEGPARRHFVYIDADKDGRMTRSEWDSMARIFTASRNAVIAVRPDGRGDVTATHVVWEATRGIPYVPTPLCYRGLVYLVKRGGIISALDAKTGEVRLPRQRLGVAGGYYASPVAAAGKICIASQRGVVIVVRAVGGARPKLDVLARNDLGEEILATPAIAGKRLHVRTASHLWCFAREESLEAAPAGETRHQD